jgi:3-oxoacyl-[acyl-carrier-protein] synthase II
MGALTPIGNTVTEFWAGLSAGVCGVAPITRFDAGGFGATLAAEVKGLNLDLYVDKKDQKRMDLYAQYGVAAATQAVADSGLDCASLDSRRLGVMVGSGIGGLGTLEEQVLRLRDKGPGRVSPLFIPMAIGNMAAGHIAIKFGAKGPCAGIVTACASGANCVGEAFRAIRMGLADVMLAGGAEATVTPLGVAGFVAITALSAAKDPCRASIPFDRERNGFVMGEGAGVLVLEEWEHARRRGARVYAEVAGYGATCDAYHMTSPDPEGAGAIEAMRLAMAEAGVAPGDISYINAHGTSTPPNDVMETRAIKALLGRYAHQIPVSSTKSMTGHMLGAAGAAEAIACVLALGHNFAPPTVNYQNPDPDCDLHYVPNQGLPVEMRCVLSNSFGFGGHNAVLCLKKVE